MHPQTLINHTYRADFGQMPKVWLLIIIFGHTGFGSMSKLKFWLAGHALMSSHLFCACSHLFSHFSAFGLKLSHVTATNTASLVLCRPVYSHYTHQRSRGCHASHARSHPVTYIIIHSLSSTTPLFTII